MVSSSCIIQRQLFLSILYSKISCFSLKCSLESFVSSISSLECKSVSLGLFLLFGVGIDKFFHLKCSCKTSSISLIGHSLPSSSIAASVQIL